MSTTRLCAAVVAIALFGCKKDKPETPTTIASGSAPASDAAPATPPDAAAAEPAAAAWSLESRPADLGCAAPAPIAGSYKAALDEGRAAGKAKQWATAVAAFERALAVQAGDAVALSELAWATLQVGDAKRSLELAERAIAAATEPNPKAASHFNAARAAEALGDLARARTHYEASLALRPNDAIRDRVGKLAPTPPRSLAPGTPLTACQALASVDAVCTCLASSVAQWGTAAGIAGAVACEPAKQRGTQAQLVVVQEQPADADAAAGGAAILLVVKRGATWSALQVVETADEVDLAETPNAMHAASVVAYEERGTTIWVETQNQYSESGGGEQEVRGEVGLTICGGEPVACAARIPLAGWDYTSIPARGDGDDRCEVRSSFAYRAALTSAGVLTLVLAAGADSGGRAGRYQR